MQLLRGASLARLARSAARLPSAPAGSSSSSRSARGSRSCRALQHRDWRSEATGARTVARRAASGGAAAAARLPADAALCAAVSLAGWLMLRPAAILCEPAPAPGQVPERVRTLAPPPAGSAPSAVCRGLARVIDMIMQVCVGALLGRLCNGRYPGLVTALAMALPTLQMAYVWDGQSFGKRYMDVQVVRRDGELLTLRCTCQRELATIVANLPCFANCISMLLWPGGRTIADRIHSTHVLRATGRPQGLRMLLPTC